MGLFNGNKEKKKSQDVLVKEILKEMEEFWGRRHLKINDLFSDYLEKINATNVKDSSAAFEVIKKRYDNFFAEDPELKDDYLQYLSWEIKKAKCYEYGMKNMFWPLGVLILGTLIVQLISENSGPMDNTIPQLLTFIGIIVLLFILMHFFKTIQSSRMPVEIKDSFIRQCQQYIQEIGEN